MPPAGELYPQLALVAAVAGSHMSLPHHWLPYSLVGRAHGWALRSLLLLTFLGALGHVSATLLLTLAISGLSGTLVSDDAYRHLSSLALLLFGLYYLYTYIIARRRGSCCELPSDPSGKPAPTLSASASLSAAPPDAPAVHRAAAASLLLLTTLSPCVGSMPVLLAVLAPPVGVGTVLAAGAAMLAASAGIMMGLVAVSFVGAKTLDFASVRRHERCILGVALVVLSFFTFFVFSKHHHHHHHGVGEMAAVQTGTEGHHVGHEHHPMGREHHHMDHDHLHEGHDHGDMDDRVLRTAQLDEQAGPPRI